MQDVLSRLFQHAAITYGVTVRVAVNFMPTSRGPRRGAGSGSITYASRTNAGQIRYARVIGGSPIRALVSLVDGREWWEKRRCSLQARRTTMSRVAN